MRHSGLTDKIIGVFYEVYNELGPGFLESVYANAMILALRQAGLTAEQERPVTVRFRGSVVGDFRADIVVEGVVLCELKAVSVLDSSAEAQMLNYLRATDIEVGLLLNFGKEPKVKRFVFDNPRKRNPC